jgi:hypothetical protein
MRTASVFLALAAALVSAQDSDSKKSPLEEFDITAGSVELRDRSAWCIGERNTCKALCPGEPKENRCEVETLDYSCTCSNGTEPGLKYYDASLYSLVCQEAFKQCTANNAGDPIELPKCEDEIQPKCGTLSTSDLPESDDSSDSSDDSSDDSEESNSDDSSSDDDDSGDDEEGEDENAGNALLRPVWGTAALAAAIGAMAYVL